ncbi:phage-related protein [Alteracholeplasma palmae J233]|uniref:Phage-related protein n=1 Tax=Alteracholeplasma palmae (strain ATCC 49389 / J233) TaxID=1318466 RepID=U4KKN3_ALTPJ|nr:zonular occludens toxin domain-containing protein [Alteracholeplasma palmae]CCV64329.1 phage-related protein [Alteracholeplasma palmae J233]
MSLESTAFKLDKIGDWNVSLNRKLARFISKKLIRYTDWVMDERIYKRMRDMTAPLHWAWINGWLASLKKAYDEFPFKKEGLYIVTGLPGAGKSSVAAEIMHRMFLATGKGSYINTAIEVPRVDENNFRKYTLHPRYEITDFFDEGKIVAYPNHYLFAALHIDEAHRIWQYRVNNSNEYMNSFKGFMEYAVGVRQYIGHIFAYTQMDKVDVQMMTLAEAIVDVQVKKGFDYEYWRETGEFRITILGWDLVFHKVVTNGSGGYTKAEYKRVFLKRTMDLKYFDSYNLRQELKGEKMDNRYQNSIKEVRA